MIALKSHVLPQVASTDGFAAVFTACVDTLLQFVTTRRKYRTLRKVSNPYLYLPLAEFMLEHLQRTTHNHCLSGMTQQLISHIYVPTIIYAYLTCIDDHDCFLMI